MIPVWNNVGKTVQRNSLTVATLEDAKDASFIATACNAQQRKDAPVVGVVYRIVPIGCRGGWAIERNGVLWTSGPSVQILGAFLDAVLKGARVEDAHDIADALRARPAPTYEERLAVFSPTGRRLPSRDPFSIFETKDDAAG